MTNPTKIETTHEAKMERNMLNLMETEMNVRDLTYEKNFFEDWTFISNDDGTKTQRTVHGWEDYIRVVKVAAKRAVKAVAEEETRFNLDEAILWEALLLWEVEMVHAGLYTEEYGMFMRDINSWNYGKVSTRERDSVHAQLRTLFDTNVQELEDESDLSLDLIEVLVADIYDVLHLSHKERAEKALAVMGQTLEHPCRQSRFSFSGEAHWPDTEGVFYGNGISAMEV